MNFSRTHLWYGFLVLCAWPFSGCKDKSEVKVYRVAKAEQESPMPQASGDGSSGMGAMPPNHPPMGSPGDMMAPAGQPSEVTGTPPSNWEVQPPSSMRLASYLVKGDNGAVADISVVALSGPAGGALDNVNRWLSQLGQPAISAEQLAKTAQHVNSPLGDVTVVDLEGLPKGADATKDGRIVAGIASVDGRTFFFKMRGNSALAAAQKAGFIEWIGTVKPAAAGPAQPAAHAAPAAATPPGAAAPAPEAGAEKPQIKWEVPAGWNSVAPSSMRYASFAVAGQNGEAADISVSVFGGDGGGDLGNVNRWRSQIGLGEIGADELKAQIVPVAGKDSEILTVDMAGPKGRILAGWAKLEGNTWFFKLIAPENLAAAEKAGFLKFLGSVQLHP
ncbi:MAG: hypothetical protein NTV93_10960 [Verrucomicrobia bacterium]|nr:hypothetical protein [Verrucomicrobiota bacterium]